MGLDITAFRQLRPETNVDMEDGRPVDWKRFWKPCVNDTFAGRAEGVDPDLVYSFAHSLEFRAGSYGGYNQWRAELCRRALGKEPDAIWNAGNPSGPFVELINFSDCEGVIGPVVSAKLARDFAENEERLLKAPYADNETRWFAEKYCCWRKAFEMAADGGAVDFH